MPRVPAAEVPAHALGAARLVDVAAEREAGAHAPERLAEDLAAGRLAAARARLVAVGAGWPVGDEHVRVQGDGVPEGPSGHAVVVVEPWVLEGPGAAPGGAVRGPEDGEGGARARGRGEADGAALVLQVGYALGPREQGLAVRGHLGPLVMAVGAVDAVEGRVEGQVVVPGHDDLALEVGLLEPVHLFRELGEAPLVRQVAAVDEHVALGQLHGAVVCVRDADEAGSSRAAGRP